MPVTIDGTTGVTTPGATVGAITGILKATSGVVSQAVAGTDYLTSTSGGAITLATAQTATGTSIDFTGIPSWVKRITVMFNGVSSTGTDNWLIRIGDSSGIQVSGYSSASRYSSVGAQVINSSIGFVCYQQNPTSINYGFIVLNLVSSNTYIASGIVGGVGYEFSTTGLKSLTGVLDRIRIMTQNGTDTFDAGTINISYE